MTNYEFKNDGIKSCFERLFSYYDENFKAQSDYTPQNNDKTAVSTRIVPTPEL